MKKGVIILSSAKMTLIGMSNYFLNAGDDLFKNLTLPEGLTKKTLTDNLLLEGGEFEVLYADPIFMQNAIGMWAEREADTFSRWVRALGIEYNPLENYDRQEAWTDTLDSDGTSRTTGTSDSTTTNNGTVTGDVSAYDSTGYQPKDKQTTSNTEVDATDATLNNTTTLDNSAAHRGRIHGNIGVTTSQQMLQSELDLGYWNIYSRITDMFLKEFCIMVYV